MKRVIAVACLFVVTAAGLAAGQWKNAGGPYGGRIQAVELAGANRVLVGTRNGGVFISQNAGATWEAANTGLADLIVNCIAVNPLNPNTAYIGTSRDGVYRTRNLGGRVIWQKYSNNLGSPYVQCLAVCRADTNTIFAGTVNGVFKSTTGGSYWLDVTSNLSIRNVTSIALAGWSPDTLYAGTSGAVGGVFKSTDKGGSWTLMDNGLTSSFVTAIRVDPNGSNVLLVSTSDGGVFKSTDAGESWSAINTGLNNFTVEDVKVLKSDSQVYYLGTKDGFYVSANGGSSWSALNTGLIDVDVQAIVANDDGSVVFAGGYWGGICKSVSGGSWQQCVQGMTNTFISDIDCHPYLDRVVQVSSYGQVFVSGDGGMTWEDHSAGIAVDAFTAIAIDQVAPDTVYCGANYGGVLKSTDCGLTWTSMNDGLGEVDVTCLRVTHVNGNPHVFVGTYSYLFRSTDGARSWQQKSSGLTNDHIWTIEIDPVTPTTIYVGTYGGGAFKTVDAGENWVPINTGLSSVFISAIAVDPADPEIVYAGAYYGGGVFRSLNGGASWTLCSHGMENSSVWSLDVNVLDSRQVLAGTFSGVYLSVDRGGEWHCFSDGLTVVDTRRVMFHRTLGAKRVFAATYGGGIYLCDDVPVGTEVNEVCLLSQNRPNPFTNGTTIEYSIAARAHVTLRVWNVAGQLVRTLVDEDQVARQAVFTKVWDGLDDRGQPVASGVYFVRLAAGNMTFTRKAVLVR